MPTVHINELPHYTYEDYRQWQGDWELIEGVPHSMAPSPTITHQGIASKIVSVLDKSIETCPECMVLHEQDWKISESTTLRPDVVLVCNEPGNAYITKRPEVIVEVLSKSSIQKDEEIKFRIYAEEGVPYYIIVYPDDLKARVFRLQNQHYLKLADVTHETVEFPDLAQSCKANINFDAVFKRFRK